MKKKRKKKEAIRLQLHGVGSAPDVPSNGPDTLCFSDRLFGSDASHVTFQERIFAVKVAENTVRNWQTVICDRTMFVSVPDNLCEIGSKESFVTLLEAAEEDLDCSFVIVCVGRDCVEKMAHMRTFMYMGFELIDPHNPVVAMVGSDPDFMFLGYEL